CPFAQQLACRVEQSRYIGLRELACQRQWRQSRAVQDLVRVRVSDAAEQTRIGQRTLQGLILHLQSLGEVGQRAVADFESTHVELRKRVGTAHQVQRRATLRAGFSERDPSVPELENRERS